MDLTLLKVPCRIVWVVLQGDDGVGKIIEGAKLAKWSLLFCFGQKKVTAMIIHPSQGY